jgi:hypothetical protein
MFLSISISFSKYRPSFFYRHGQRPRGAEANLLMGRWDIIPADL